MNKVFGIFIIIAACCLAQVADARTAIDFFVEAPTNLIPLVRPQLRMDMADYHSSGMETPVRNVFGGESRILEASPEKVIVQLSSLSRLELDVITAGSDTILAMITTTSTPQPDSKITLFSADWEPKAVQPVMPGLAEFAPKGDASVLQREIPMFFVSATYNPDSGLFEFTDTTPAYYHPSEIPQALSALPEKISLRWTGKKWSKR